MSKPRTPFADVEASLDKVKRAWIKKMLAALAKSQPVTSTSATLSAQSAGQAPLLQGGIPSQLIDKVLEQQRANVFSGKKQEEAARKVEEKKANKTPAFDAPQDVPPVFQYPSRKRPILDADVRLIENAEHAKLPDDLKSKMTVDVWQEIKAQRHTLIATYLRLKEYGAWDAVKRVKGIKEKLPWHGQIGSLVFGAYGTGGIAFEEHKAGALGHKLISTGHFGQDNKIMSLMHAGQKSYREWSGEQKIPAGVLDNSIHEWSEKNPAPPSSLHISVGPGTDFDAHIDRISPVTKPHGGDSVPNTESGQHIRDEVIGPTGRGVRPNVTIEKVPTGPRDVKKVPTVWLNLVLEWDFPGTDKHKKNKVVNKHTPRPEPPPVDVHKKIMVRVKQVKQKFPKTSEGNELDPGVIAEIMAGKVLEAARKGKDSIGFDFFDYQNTPLSDAERQSVLKAMEEISQIVSSELGPEAAKVRNLTVRIAAHKSGNVPVRK